MPPSASTDWNVAVDVGEFPNASVFGHSSAQGQILYADLNFIEPSLAWPAR
jgi:hypothetical protein